MLNKIIATNNRGDSVAFDDRLRLLNGLDLSGLGANVNMSETRHAGATYQNTRLQTRSGAFEFHVSKRNLNESLMDDKRAELFRVFNPEKNPIRIDFENTDGEAFYLNIELTSTPLMPPDKKSDNAAFQRAMVTYIATDPYIYRKDNKSIEMATWVGAFEFPFSFESTFEVGYREQNQIINAINEGQSKNGFIATLTASSTVVNPSILNATTYEEIKLIGTMYAGDVVVISTYFRKKSIMLIRGGVTTNVFGNLTPSSKLFELEAGDNLIKYDAEDGLDYLDVKIEYNEKLVGV